MLLGKGRAEHPEFLRQRGPDGGIAAGIAIDELLTRLEIIGIGQEAGQRVADHVLRFGVCEIHYRRS